MTAAMAAGDGAAIEAFYRRCFDAMLSMSRRAVGHRARDESLVLDIVHDAMLRIVRCVKTIDTEPHLLNWTRLVVQSCALDRLRQEQRRQRRELARPEMSPPDDLDEQSAWLAAEIAKLEPSLAKLIKLRFAEGWTLARIATAFRTTTGQIDGRLRRAIQKLRADAGAAFDE
jgi:RNA polymerase sigma factor (sigma-70 family)